MSTPFDIVATQSQLVAEVHRMHRAMHEALQSEDAERLQQLTDQRGEVLDKLEALEDAPQLSADIAAKMQREHHVLRELALKFRDDVLGKLGEVHAKSRARDAYRKANG